MNPWPFIIASYGIAIAGTLVVLADSVLRMRRAEAAAQALKRR